MATATKEKQPTSVFHKVLTVIGTILCVILLPVLLINLTLIAKSYLNPDEVPGIAGYAPLIVLTDSMYPDIHAGDLIITRTIEGEEVQVGDTIAFFDPASNSGAIVTHQVIEIVEEDGVNKFRTKGIANNTEDKKLVEYEDLVGIYKFRIAGAGNIAMFMQTTAGLIVCVICPLLLLIGYDMLRRRKYDKAKKQDTDALLAELEALKAAKAEKEAAEAPADGE